MTRFLLACAFVAAGCTVQASTGPSVASAPVQAAPLVCGAGDDLILDGLVIDNPHGAAVDASGGCDVHLSNCRLSGQVGVLATGAADVHLSNCTVAGSVAAIDASGSSDVTLIATSVAGAVTTSGVAEVH